MRVHDCRTFDGGDQPVRVPCHSLCFTAVKHAPQSRTLMTFMSCLPYISEFSMRSVPSVSILAFCTTMYAMYVLCLPHTIWSDLDCAVQACATDLPHSGHGSHVSECVRRYGSRGSGAPLGRQEECSERAIASTDISQVPLSCDLPARATATGYCSTFRRMRPQPRQCRPLYRESGHDWTSLRVRPITREWQLEGAMRTPL